LKGGFQIVTLSGEIVRSGGAITGGETRVAREGSSVLAREREWRELPPRIEAAETQIAALQTEIAANASRQTRLEEARSDLDRREGRLAEQIGEARQTLQQEEAGLAALQKEVNWRTDLQTAAEAEIAANRRRQEEARQAIEQFRARQEAAEQEAARLDEQIAALADANLLARLNEAQNQVNLLQQKQRSQRELLDSLTHTLNQTRAQLESRTARVTALAEERDALLARLDIQRQEHATLLESIETFTRRIEPAETTLQGLETEQAAAEEEENRQHTLLRRLEEEHNRRSLEMARCQDAIETLHRQIEDDFGLVQVELSEDQVGQPVLPLESLVTQLSTVAELPEGIEEDIRHLRVRIRRLGSINPDAPREYAELQERYDFLTGQMADLEKAAADLKTVIAELDKIMEEAFLKTFTAVAREFQNYFKILFGGGEAQLLLTDPDNVTESGVEIVARPPGKRSQSLELLSGGERSLTAQALIFALLKTSPTPYCVFDEVDAMLDEANVDRFRQALVELSRDIQFIVITHNRKTIEIADTIYGISMGSDAVSRVVSLKLEEVPENALQSS
ncbi:MAG: hypothetical protein D6796_07750, partial [Caldilineae bacterium]